ncbi:centromere protein O [Platichthys flesus]|uniref:centromere protein O n=1 Tax=Platichthys flesus TaxID=8260 RepID=UPI002DBC1926|nr:centromere protein O [Platichthys flesus]
MEGTSTKGGVLSLLSVLEVQARSRRHVPPQRSRVKELRAEAEALRVRREQLKTEIQTHQSLQRLRTSLDKQSTHHEEEEEEEMDEDSENSQLLKLMARHTRVKDLLLAHHLIGGYDIVKTRHGKGVCVSVATAYEGVCLETYNLEMDLKPTLRICRHNVPPFVPLSGLAEQGDMQTDIRAFLDTLSQHLNAFAGRKQQLKLVKEQHTTIEVMESNALCSILVLMFTVPKTKTAILCTLNYSEHTSCLPARVQFECDVKEILESTEWRKNCSLLMETPLHKALMTMKKMGNIN